jgi:hypothetical protein
VNIPALLLKNTLRFLIRAGIFTIVEDIQHRVLEMSMGEAFMNAVLISGEFGRIL